MPHNMRNGTESIGECSSSSSLSSQQEIEDDRMIAMVLSEEYAKLDGAVGQRVSHLAPIPVDSLRCMPTGIVAVCRLCFDNYQNLSTLRKYPNMYPHCYLEELFHFMHVPKINSYIPDSNDATMDHQRLIQRLHVYGLYEQKVSGDGNCQFRALSDQMYRSPEYHKHIRKEVVKQLKDYRSLYEGYVPMKYSRYYKKMAKSGEWGDHITLQAAADKFAAKICLLTSFRDTCFIEIVPQNQPPKRELWLSFWSEVHYNSLYDLRDAPIQRKPRRKHWLF